MPDLTSPATVVTPATFTCHRGPCTARVHRYRTFCSQLCKRVDAGVRAASVKPDGPVTFGGSANVHQAAGLSWLDTRAARTAP